MIGYFDTSAFVPLLVEEPSTPYCKLLWDESDDVVTTQLLYVEAAAALAQALRMGRLSPQTHQSALRDLDRLWPDFQVIETTHDLVVRAGQIAYACSLRGYDSVHCAAAEQIDDTDLVVFSDDVKLLNACRSLGMAVADINNPD